MKMFYNFIAFIGNWFFLISIQIPMVDLIRKIIKTIKRRKN